MKNTSTALVWRRSDTAAVNRAAKAIESVPTLIELNGVSAEWGFALSTTSKVHKLSMGNCDVIVIGVLRDRDGSPADLEQLPEMRALPDPSIFTDLLISRFWGEYLLVVVTSDAVHALTDPSGGLPAHHAVHNGLTILGTDIDARWLACIEKPAVVDVKNLASIIACPTMAPFVGPLEGVRPLIPGQLTPVAVTAVTRQAWRPAQLALAGRSADAGRIRSAVRISCAAMSSEESMVLLSGGLDSSIVLGSMPRDRRPLTAVNFVTDTAEGDERAFAEIVALRNSTRLLERKSCARPSIARIAEAPQLVAPYVFGLDSAFADIVDAAAQELGASHALTGQGGDALFFQYASEQVLLDRFRHHGLRALRPSLLADDARRARTSVWSMAWSALRDPSGRGWRSRRRLGEHLFTQAMRAEIGPAVPLHPWVDETLDLSAAKLIHLSMIADAQIFMSRRPFGATPQRHPLLAQPVLEAVIALRVSDMVHGSNNRQFARDAFADVLPVEIAARRTKGAASNHYSLAVADSLPFLRDYLLDGQLIKLGIIDRVEIEKALTTDHLFYSDDHSAIIMQVSGEAWLQSWSR